MVRPVGHTYLEVKVLYTTGWTPVQIMLFFLLQHGVGIYQFSAVPMFFQRGRSIMTGPNSCDSEHA